MLTAPQKSNNQSKYQIKFSGTLLLGTILDFADLQCVILCNKLMSDGQKIFGARLGRLVRPINNNQPASTLGPTPSQK